MPTSSVHSSKVSVVGSNPNTLLAGIIYIVSVREITESRVFSNCLLAQNSRSTLIRILPRNTTHMGTLVTVDLVTLTIFHHTHSILLTDAAFVRFGSLAFGEAWHFMR